MELLNLKEELLIADVKRRLMSSLASTEPSCTGKDSRHFPQRPLLMINNNQMANE